MQIEQSLINLYIKLHKFNFKKKKKKKNRKKTKKKKNKKTGQRKQVITMLVFLQPATYISGQFSFFPYSFIKRDNNTRHICGIMKQAGTRRDKILTDRKLGSKLQLE